MTIEDAFSKFNGPSAIFDPIPSYSGDWTFTVENLRKNAKIDENERNLFDEFYYRTYQKPLEDIFETSKIFDLNVGMISTPNENGIGRCLKYSKIDFFASLIEFLNQELDNHKKSEEQKREYLKELVSHITESNDQINLFFSEMLKLKCEKLKDLIKNEINSEYFESAMKDYALHKETMDFSTYLNSMTETTEKFQMGMLKLGNFFDKKINFNELYKAFVPDIFYLLFAQIIYASNLIKEKESGILDNSYNYLYCYVDTVNEFIKSNKNYNPKIIFITPSGKRIQTSSWQIQNEINILMKKHPEVKRVKFAILSNINQENYKDIRLMEKIVKIYNEEATNWKFLAAYEDIERVSYDSSLKANLSKRKAVTKEELIAEVDMRMEILENSGYLGTPIKGLNEFKDYFAFIYPSGYVVLEKFWEKDVKPAIKSATYIINIDNFIEMTKISNINLTDYIRSLSENSVKRVFHTTINNWQRNLYNGINGTYKLEDAINFINSLEDGESTNE